jgi:pyruvate,water dikinase
MDLEWAAARGLVFCLQARPATATPVIKSWEDHQIWTNLNTGEVFPDVPTPSSWSMIQIFITPLFRSIFRLFGADVLKGPSAGLVAGRIYFNVNTAVAALKPFSFALPRVPRIAQALGGGRIEVYQQALMDIPDEALPDLGFRWPKYILSWPGILYVLITHLPRRGEAFLARMKARGKHLARLDFTGMSTPELARTFPKLLHENLADWDLLYLFTRTSVLLVFQKAYRDWLDDPPRSAKAVEG